MPTDPVLLTVDESLRTFLNPRHRSGDIRLPLDDGATLGHLVQSAGIPLTEVGALTIADAEVDAGYRPGPGDTIRVTAVTRPQPLPAGGARFLLDVHLGSLARRMRLVGLDTRYGDPVDDAELAEVAVAEDRILLSKDLGLLRRRVLRHAAYVRGTSGDDQLADVLDRFDPPLAPFTRCPACNGSLRTATLAEVADEVEEGTRRSYQEFARCTACGQVYWKGAHARQLDAIVRGTRR
jgi:uncharacterized protein with PIN domain